MQLLRQHWSSFDGSKLLWSVVLPVLMVIGALVINFNAGIYATEKASNAVTDIILNNIRVFDVDGIFIYGPVVLWLFVACVLIYRPKRIPFTLKAITLFTLIRSLFVTLTHLGPFPTQTVVQLTGFMSHFITGGDLFFSAHTGAPFLLALIFWESKSLRLIFLLASLLFAVVVLLGHLHYSIDVLSAFFITFSIYHLACFCFPEDQKLFNAAAVLE